MNRTWAMKGLFAVSGCVAIAVVYTSLAAEDSNSFSGGKVIGANQASNPLFAPEKTQSASQTEVAVLKDDGVDKEANTPATTANPLEKLQPPAAPHANGATTEEYAHNRSRELEVYFAEKKPDSQTTAILTDSFNVAFAAGEFTDSKVGEVECRNTMCQMSVEHSNDQAVQKFFERFAVVTPWATSAEFVAERRSDNTVFTRIFLTTEGHALPGDLPRNP